MQSNHSPPPDMGGALLTLKNLTTYLLCKTPKKGQLSQKRSPKKGKAPGFLNSLTALSADVLGEGKCDKAVRMSVWKARICY